MARKRRGTKKASKVTGASAPALSLTAGTECDSDEQSQELVVKRRKINPEDDGIRINRGEEFLDDVCILICEGEILPNGYVCFFILPLQN